MAGGKQTPRQKMINLMYVVFIAMLAMTIDQQIIRSYKDTNQSLTDTRLTVEERNDKIFKKTLEAKAVASPETYGSLLDQYKNLEGKTNDLVGFIVFFFYGTIRIVATTSKRKIKTASSGTCFS